MSDPCPRRPCGHHFAYWRQDLPCSVCEGLAEKGWAPEADVLGNPEVQEAIRLGAEAFEKWQREIA